MNNAQLTQRLTKRSSLSLTIDGDRDTRLADLITDIEVAIQRYVEDCRDADADPASISFTSHVQSILHLDNTEPF